MSQVNAFDDDDTVPTDGDEMVEELRKSGLFGPRLTYRWAAASDVGLVRSDNEDSWCQRAERIFVVADGMGGYSGGALAARVAAAQFADALVAAPDADLDAVLHRINTEVRNEGAKVGSESLGTTLVALVATGDNRMVMVNVGDSRVYRIRDGELTALSRDQNVRAELVDAGLDPSEFAHHGQKLNGLTSYIGGDSDRVRAQIERIVVQADDRFLLCSDGVHRQVDAAALVRTILDHDCETAATELVAQARAAGGRDNATALIVEAIVDGEVT